MPKYLLGPHVVALSIMYKQLLMYTGNSTDLHTQKAYTHTGSSSPQSPMLSASCIYAFCLRIAIRQPMRTPWCTHTGVIAYMHELPTIG